MEGFTLKCNSCGSEIVITNDYKLAAPIELYTVHDDGINGPDRIEINLDCKCGNSVEIITWGPAR